jgi:hypothetical protein
MYRQFAYILAPARAWAGFGGLDVTVHVPEEWTVVSTPGLQRDGGVLRGTFTDVPADAIALTLRPPVASGYDGVKYGAWGLFAIVGLGGLGLCRRWERGKGSAAPDHAPAESAEVKVSRAGRLGRAAAVGLAYGVVVFAAGMMAARGPDAVFPVSAAEHELIDRFRLSDGYAGLATNAGILLLSISAAAIGSVVTYAAGRRSTA